MRGHNYYDLIRELSLTDFKLRYKNSILGYLWSLLNPLLLFGVLFLVFSVFLRFDVEHYALYLLFGIISWGFFSESTTNAMHSIIGKASLIKKTYFPRWIIVLSSNLTTSIGFALNILVFFVFFFISGSMLGLTTLILVPYYLMFFCVVLGTSMFLAALCIRFRDLIHIWGVLVQLGFWITPIIYPLELIPAKFHFWILLNPLARIIMDTRNAMIYGQLPSMWSFLGILIFSLIILVVGIKTFNRLSRRFAEWL